MEWNSSETITLAKQSCSLCQGLGLRGGDHASREPCNCVLRKIFRACYARFRYCVAKEKHVSHASLEFIPGPAGKLAWGRKDEEYVADFCLVSRRELEGISYDIFKFHFLLGADWRLCTRRLKIDRGSFFHEVYRIEQRLGRVFRELEPYGLFPLEEYFRNSLRTPQKGPAFRTAGMGLPFVPPPATLRPPLLARLA